MTQPWLALQSLLSYMEDTMAEAQHQHPNYDQRIKALEEQIKKLQKDLQDLKHKVDTHDHPHSH